MPLKHFRLAAQPFGATPDPDFLFFSPTHRETMASLEHGILSRRGFTALIAEPGMEKTSLLFSQLHLPEDSASTAFFFQTLCKPKEFLRALLGDIGIKDRDRDFIQMHTKLNGYLLSESRRGPQLVVVDDEAQNLDDSVLEVVRMLSNFETSKKLMHVLLARQPQVVEKLAAEDLTQLRQRISIVARLALFHPEDTRIYIEDRLRLAGFTSPEPLFTDRAYALIAEYLRGIPRNINNLCFNAMSLGCATQCTILDHSKIQEVIDDLELEKLMPPFRKSANKIRQINGSSRTLARWANS